MVEVNEALTGDGVEVPRGFVTYAGNAGIKDGTLDLSIIASTIACVADGVFTKSLFAGPSVVLSRSNLESGAPGLNRPMCWSAPPVSSGAATRWNASGRT